MDNNADLIEWLYTPCLPEDVKESPDGGFYLGISKVREKLLYMDTFFHTRVDVFDFRHFLFSGSDKRTFASGSLNIEIWRTQAHGGTILFKRIVGAYTYNTGDYDNDRESIEQYAGILKSLCISNALMSEYPQFGSLLNKVDLERRVQGRKPSFKTSDSVKDTLKNLGK